MTAFFRSLLSLLGVVYRTSRGAASAPPFRILFLVFVGSFFMFYFMGHQAGPASTAYYLPMDHFHKQALAERKCALYGRSFPMDYPTQYWCKLPEPGIYPARQLLESIDNPDVLPPRPLPRKRKPS